MKIGSVVVTFNPNVDRLKQNLSSMNSQVDMAYIVDNGSKNIEAISDLVDQFSNLNLIKLGDNFGIAKAQNVGFEEFYKNKYNWVLTLDQDTVIPLNYVELIKPKLALSNAGIVTGAYIDQRWDAEKIEQMRKLRMPEVQIVSEEISSGNMVSVRGWKIVNGFNNQLFIDYVDFDFDYKLNEKGYCIYRINTIEFQHEIGDPIKNDWKISALLLKNRDLFDHSASRLYYLNRNRIIVRRLHPRYGSPIKMTIREILNLREICVMGEPRNQKLKQSLLGIIHGIFFKVN